MSFTKSRSFSVSVKSTGEDYIAVLADSNREKLSPAEHEASFPQD